MRGRLLCLALLSTATFAHAPNQPAKPRTPVGQWMDFHDWPLDLHDWEGTAAFILTIGKDGRVITCVVPSQTVPHGYVDALCRALTRRAVFFPATGRNGKPVDGRYEGRVRFLIP
jgi:periplasmic protein TonB